MIKCGGNGHIRLNSKGNPQFACWLLLVVLFDTNLIVVYSTTLEKVRDGEWFGGRADSGGSSCCWPENYNKFLF